MGRGAARVVASQALAIVPFGPLSALRYVHMVHTPVIAVCGPFPRGPFPRVPHRPPVDPGKGSRGNSKALPNSDEPERAHHDDVFFFEAATDATHLHIAHCTCRCAEMTRKIDAEPTAVNDKKKLTSIAPHREEETRVNRATDTRHLPWVLGGMRRRERRGKAWRGVASEQHAAAAAALLTPPPFPLPTSFIFTVALDAQRNELHVSDGSASVCAI
jgi:hypothetical protein